jgi:hypothetical protein
LQSGERPGYHVGTLFLLLTPEQPMLVPIQIIRYSTFASNLKDKKDVPWNAWNGVCGCPFMLGKLPLASMPSLMGSSKPIPLG